jgi:hypothetical protein
VTGRGHADWSIRLSVAFEGLMKELGEGREARRGPADDRQHE